MYKSCTFHGEKRTSGWRKWIKKCRAACTILNLVLPIFTPTFSVRQWVLHYPNGQIELNGPPVPKNDQTIRWTAPAFASVLECDWIKFATRRRCARYIVTWEVSRGIQADYSPRKLRHPLSTITTHLEASMIYLNSNNNNMNEFGWGPTNYFVNVHLTQSKSIRRNISVCCQSWRTDKG